MARRAAELQGTWAAFLRGVNVGGRNMAPMESYRKLLAELGYTGVRTYVASGNAVFRATGTEQSLGKQIEKAVAEWFDVPARAVVRSGQDLRRIAAKCPFPQAAPNRLLVIFCADEPKGKPDAARSPRDVFTVRGREMFVHYKDGVGQSKLTLDYIERCTGTTGTGRNWTTVTTLAKWTAEAEAAMVQGLRGG